MLAQDTRSSTRWTHQNTDVNQSNPSVIQLATQRSQLAACIATRYTHQLAKKDQVATETTRKLHHHAAVHNTLVNNQLAIWTTRWKEANRYPDSTRYQSPTRYKDQIAGYVTTRYT